MDHDHEQIAARTHEDPDGARDADHATDEDTAAPEACYEQVASAAAAGVPSFAPDFMGIDLTHFARNSAALLPQHEAGLCETRAFLMDRAEAAGGHRADWWRLVRAVDGYASDEGSDEHNMALSVERAEAVRDHLLRGVEPDPAPEVRGFGEDHEGQGADRSERPWFRAAHVAFQDVALQQRPAPAPEPAQEQPAREPEGPRVDGALEGVDMGALLEQPTVGDGLLRTAAEEVGGRVVEAVVGELLGGFLTWAYSTYQIVVAGFEGMSTAVDRRDARARGFAYGLTYTLDGLDVGALPAVSPVANMNPNIYGSVPGNACAVVFRDGGLQHLANEAAADAVDEDRVQFYYTRHSGEWQLGTRNGAYRARRLRGTALSAGDPVVRAIWDSLPPASRTGTTFEAFARELVVRFPTLGALLEAALAQASTDAKAQFLSGIYRQAGGPAAGTMPYPEPLIEGPSRICGMTVLPQELIDERTDEEQDAIDAAHAQRRREETREHERRSRRVHEMTTAPLATGQEIELMNGQTVRQ